MTRKSFQAKFFQDLARRSSLQHTCAHPKSQGRPMVSGEGLERPIPLNQYRLPHSVLGTEESVRCLCARELQRSGQRRRAAGRVGRIWGAPGSLGSGNSLSGSR
jgi:hypothetical protein